jgi:hypothetical protein
VKSKHDNYTYKNKYCIVQLLGIPGSLRGKAFNRNFIV